MLIDDVLDRLLLEEPNANEKGLSSGEEDDLNHLLADSESDQRQVFTYF